MTDDFSVMIKNRHSYNFPTSLIKQFSLNKKIQFIELYFKFIFKLRKNNLMTEIG